MIKLNFGLAGEFKIEAAQVDAQGVEIPGTRRVLADWFDNIIVDTGLDAMAATSNYTDGCVVGSGNTPPTAADTALQSFVAGTTSRTGTPVRSTSSTPPYRASIQKVFRFGTGVAAGNLSEVGISVTTATSGSTLFSRALITDPGGTPITITVLSTEILDVTYRLNVYPPVADATGNVTIAGNSHAYTVRPCTVTTLVGSGGTGAFGFGWGAGASLGYTTFPMTCRTSAYAYTGTIGAVTSSPGGTSIGSNTNTNNVNDAYSPGSFTRTHTIPFTTGQGNHASGIGSIVYSIGMSCFQLGFVPNVMKINTQVFAIEVQSTWGRYTP